MSGSRTARNMRHRIVLAGAVLAVFAMGAWFWSTGWLQGAAGTPLRFLGGRADLNLLVITLDTTRADRIGAYGWADAATPALDRLAREGVLFEQALAPAPLTLPVHCSLFTATYPWVHGVRDNGGFVLDDRHFTLAERLRDRGYRTGGFVGAYVLDRRWGIAQGFDTYFDDFDVARSGSPSLLTVERPGSEVVDRALTWLQGVASARFFSWVHLYDPHSPYAAPEPYRSRFAGRPYLGEIAFVDAQVERIRTFLDERGLLDRTIVVVVGDHGESLGEHGEETHGFFVYHGVLRVPFIVRAPFSPMRGRRVTDVVRTLDLGPTVLEMIGAPMDGAHDGVSLVRLMTGAERELGLSAHAEAVYPRFHFGWSELQSLTAGRYKYIHAPRPELFDLEQDPGELRNLYAERPAVADRMATEIRAQQHRGQGAEPTVEIDPDARARLASLGYVATFAASTAGDASSLADPKDKIDVFNKITTARELLQEQGDPDQGLALLEQIVEKDPAVIDAWLMIGNEQMRRRAFTEALESSKRALAMKPDYDLAVMNMAKAYRALGRDEDALVGYRRLLALDAGNFFARQEAAQILIDRGHLAEAERELAIVLEQQPTMAAARNSLGALRVKQGDVAAGEREIRTALEQRPDLRLAHFNLAVVAEERGDLTRATEEYRQEIALFPDNYMAHFNLGKLFERVGDRVSQESAYRGAIEANPTFAAGHLFLAKLLLDLGRLDEAARVARRGLALGGDDEFVPLGHFVMADVYSRQGRLAEAQREVAAGRRLQSRLKSEAVR